MTDQPTTPPTELELDEIEARAAHLHEYATLTDGPLQADADQLTGEDVPTLRAEIDRLKGQRKYLLDQLARKDARTGEGDTALREFLGGEPQPGPDTLPAWLYQRFMASGVGWENLNVDQRAYWEHHARAVRRAVARGGFKTASEVTSALLAASPASSVSESAQSPTGAPEGPLRDSGPDAARIALTRSDLAALLAHQADVLAARWRAVAPGAGAWEVAAALSLTSHANELSAETERPAVAELLDNIWTFPLEQQGATLPPVGLSAGEPPPRRTLTPNEYSSAWHAVEGAAGEEGADPGTVLHAVLNRLGIDTPAAEEATR